MGAVLPGSPVGNRQSRFFGISASRYRSGAAVQKSASFLPHPIMRTSEPKPHQINVCQCPFDFEIRTVDRGLGMRTSQSGHWYYSKKDLISRGRNCDEL